MQRRKRPRKEKTTVKIVLPFVVAKALNWWYNHPLALPPQARGLGRIVHHKCGLDIEYDKICLHIHEND